MFRRRKPDDFAEELRSHLAMEADALQEEGCDGAESRRRAHLNVGNLMHYEERFYQAGRWAWLDGLRQDVRYSIRQLRLAPVFTLTAALTLALGIGATTAIFTLVHAVLLKSLPVARPESLYTVGNAKHVGVYSGMAEDWDIFSRDLYLHLRDGAVGFEELAAFQGDPRRVGVRRAGDQRAAEPYMAEYVSGNYFATFGVPAFAGRAIAPDDDRRGAAPVAVIAYRTWQEKYALDPAVVGATFNINGTAVTIVGAAAPGYFGDALRNNPPDFWLPLADEPAVNHAGWANNPDLHWLYLMGRIQPGVAVATAEARMRVRLRQWLSARSGELGPDAAAQIPRQTLHLRSGASGIGLMRATYSTGLELLMAASGFVLLIVCANLANLMLVRGLARRRQISISLALGAARWRLARQALTESLLLSFIGGVLGVALAFAGTRTLLDAVFTGASYVPISPKPDLAVLAFAFLASLVTGLIFGAAPAWSVNRADPMDALHGAGRSTEHTGSLPRRGLVVVQAALSLALLAGAILLMQSLRNLARQDFGFAAEGRVAVRFDPNLAGYTLDRLEPLYREIKERLSKLPGVAGVSYALYSPLSGSSWTTDVSIDGQPPAPEGKNLTPWNRVGPDYFETVGTRIPRGRGILESDTESTRHVAVINEAFARRYFPDEDPIGKHFGVTASTANDLEIVGIAENAKYNQPEQAALPMFFRPRSQVTQHDNRGTMAFETRSLFATDIVLRLGPNTGPLEERIRRTFAEIDPNLTVIRIQPFDLQIGKQFSQQALIARLTGLFGITALLLASIGLYGVTSYSVARRSKEIGVRVALGAGRGSIVAMVMRQAYSLVAIGLALGIPLALGVGRLLESQLYGIHWNSAPTLAAAAVALAVFALVATVAPARRAASLDPIETLRRD